MSAPKNQSRLVPVYRQPPIYLVASVVLAAVLPLLLPAVGISMGPGVVAAEAADSSKGRRAMPASDAEASGVVPRAMPAVEPTQALAPAAVASVEPDRSASLDDPTFDAPILFDDESEEHATESDAGASEPDPRRRTSHRPVPVLAKAKAACRKGDKKVARSAYRQIPFGDERRREIRRACREQGIWIL